MLFHEIYSTHFQNGIGKKIKSIRHLTAIVLFVEKSMIE